MLSQQMLILESTAAPLELLKFYREPGVRLAVQCCACHVCGCVPGLEQPRPVGAVPAHGWGTELYGL